MRSEVRRSVSEGIRGQLHQLPEMWPEPERAPAREWSESPEPEPERRRRGGEEETVSCSPAHTSMAGPRPHWRQCQHPSNDPTQRTSIRHNNVIREYEVSQGIIALKILHFYVECHIIENRDIIEDIIKEILCASSSWPTSEYLSYDKL